MSNYILRALAYARDRPPGTDTVFLFCPNEADLALMDKRTGY